MKKLFLMGRSEVSKTSLTQALKGEELHYEKRSTPLQTMIPSTLPENMQNLNASA